MKIVTWNVQRPTLTCRKNAGRIEHLIGVRPDVAMLTETSTAIDLGPELQGFFTQPSPRKPTEGEAVAAIWIRNETFTVIGQVGTADPREAVCIEIESGTGRILVYASIIPYHGYKGPDGVSKNWEENHKAIQWHREDWMKLRETYPNHQMIVGGDFNQTRDGTGGYGTTEGRQLLTEALASSGLTCVTEADFRANAGLSRQNIDHVCLSSKLASAVVDVRAWEGTVSGVKLSDHNGITVVLDNNHA